MSSFTIRVEYPHEDGEPEWERFTKWAAETLPGAASEAGIDARGISFAFQAWLAAKRQGAEQARAV